MHFNFRGVSTITIGTAFLLLGSDAYAQNARTQIVIGAANSVPIDTAQKNSAETTMMPKPNSSAPALSRIFINNVCTDAAGNGCETIASGQSSTANTYSGANVYTFVWEIGYGSGEIAHQGGAQISNTYLVGKVPVCVSGNQYTTNCPAGSTVSGYRYEWNNGYYLNQGFAQNFAAQDTSINSPNNTISTGIQIKYSH